MENVKQETIQKLCLRVSRHFDNFTGIVTSSSTHITLNLRATMFLFSLIEHEVLQPIITGIPNTLPKHTHKVHIDIREVRQ